MASTTGRRHVASPADLVSLEARVGDAEPWQPAWDGEALVATFAAPAELESQDSVRCGDDNIAEVAQAEGEITLGTSDDVDAPSGDPLTALGGAEGDDKRRGRRRSKTIARKQMLRERRRMLAQGTIPEIVDYERPQARAECRDALRPCMYVSCRYHLYLDVNPVTGSIKLNFPDKEVWELEETCALDVAERGGITLEEVGEIMNLTRERIRQVEVSGLEKLKRRDAALQTFVDGRELEVGPLVVLKRKGPAAGP